MTIELNIMKHTPTGVEKVILDDVSSYEMNDVNLTLHFNTTPDEVYPLINSETAQPGEWVAVSIFATKVNLKVDMGATS